MRPTKRNLLIGLAAAFALANAFAAWHAYRFTHFSSGGKKTSVPERLSFFHKVCVLVGGVNVPRPTNRETPRDYGMEFETHTFPGAFETPLEAWLIRSPEGEGLVIMFHGYAASKEVLLPAAKSFHKMGYDALMVDFHGSGGSGGSSTSLGYHEATDVLGAVKFARENLGESEPILYGVSMGAVSVLRAVRIGDIAPRALVLEAPFDRMLSTVGHRFNSMGLPALPGAHLLVFWGGLLSGHSGFAHNPVDYARAVTCPTLLMVGERDARVSETEAKSMLTALAGKKEFRVFSGAGHEVLSASQPEFWRLVVESFLPSGLSGQEENGGTDPQG